MNTDIFFIFKKIENFLKTKNASRLIIKETWTVRIRDGEILEAAETLFMTIKIVSLKLSNCGQACNANNY